MSDSGTGTSSTAGAARARRFRGGLSIQSKLLIMLLVVSLISSLVVGAIGFINGRQSLHDAAVDQLITIRSMRAAEITEAYAAMHARVQQHATSGTWDDFALNFTEDAEYVEHAFGTFVGRDAIREWSVATMTSFPGSVMTGFPLAWQTVDESTSRLICEVRNLMPDPGDGSVHEQSNLTIMTYAGDGLFSREEDV
ncbi:MAG: nuclear transport factor 2 family protein, partial [Solirubrobacteraceae bacterium]|nr:nuclear transport factor 2 family protein [Solirubrobacteraceae bacterium]